jgi:hypothetical protein
MRVHHHSDSVRRRVAGWLATTLLSAPPCYALACTLSQVGIHRTGKLRSHLDLPLQSVSSRGIPKICRVCYTLTPPRKQRSSRVTDNFDCGQAVLSTAYSCQSATQSARHADDNSSGATVQQCLETP